MRKQKKLILTILLLFSFVISQTAIASAMSSTQLQEGTATGEMFYPATFYSATESQGFGPGSEVPFRTPMESGYLWKDSVEPLKVVWTFYQPGLRPIYTMEKDLTYKKQITEGTDTGKWVFADTATFTVPALAETGTWLAKSEIKMADGTVRQGVSAENSQSIYIAFPVEGGDPITNLFGAPWYFFNMKMPPLFWFPLILVWGPALFIAICFISPRVSETFKRGFGRLGEARSKWKK